MAYKEKCQVGSVVKSKWEKREYFLTHPKELSDSNAIYENQGILGSDDLASKNSNMLFI